MHALYEKSIDFDSITCVKPNIARLEKAYNAEIASPIISKCSKINILGSRRR
jgi:hypothetical protein